MQPTLESLGQFLLININLSKLFDCNQHLFKFISIKPKKKSFVLI